MSGNGFGFSPALIRRNAANWYNNIVALDDFCCLFDADDISAGAVSSITPVDGSLIGAMTQATTDKQPTCVVGAPHGGNYIDFDQSGVVKQYIEAALIDSIGNAANGMTVFAAYKGDDSGGDNTAVFCHHAGVTAERNFRLYQGRSYFNSGAAETLNYTGVSDTDWHIVIASVLPTGAGGTGLGWSARDGYAKTAEDLTDPLATINAACTQPIRCGVSRHSVADPWDGRLAVWGALNVGFDAGATAIQTIFETINAHLGIV